MRVFEKMLDRLFAMCVMFAASVFVLEWAVARLAPLLPFLLFGVVVFAFFRWQRR